MRYYDVRRSCRCLYWSRYCVYDLWYGNSLSDFGFIIFVLCFLYYREFSSSFAIFIRVLGK